MITIGEIIRINRIEQKISQENLSYGICSVSNLSRIENGVQTPSRATFESLMERLKISPEVFPSFVNENEVGAYRLKHQISKKIGDGKMDEAELLLNKLDDGQKHERLYKQFIQYIRIVLRRGKENSSGSVLIDMKKVAKMSIKDCSPKKIIHQVLTKDDLHILNSLAISYYNAGEKNEGIELLYSLKDYMEQKVVDDDGISPLYTMVLYNLSKWVGLAGNHNEAILLCDKAIQRCIEYGAYISFANLLYNKGYALVMLERKDEAKKYLQESYYIDRARGKIYNCETTKKFANKHKLHI